MGPGLQCTSLRLGLGVVGCWAEAAARQLTKVLGRGCSIQAFGLVIRVWWGLGRSFIHRGSRAAYPAGGFSQRLGRSVCRVVWVTPARVTADESSLGGATSPQTPLLFGGRNNSSYWGGCPQTPLVMLAAGYPAGLLGELIPQTPSGTTYILV